MNNFIILLAQKKDESAIGIFILFVVAAILGFVVMRLYFKSIYKWQIKGFQFEKDNLKKRILALNADKIILYKSLQIKDIEAEQLTKEMNTLKVLYSQEIQKKVEALEHVKKQLFQVNNKFINRNN
jgi:hypothetical protein